MLSSQSTLASFILLLVASSTLGAPVSSTQQPHSLKTRATALAVPNHRRDLSLVSGATILKRYPNTDEQRSANRRHSRDFRLPARRRTTPQDQDQSPPGGDSAPTVSEVAGDSQPSSSASSSDASQPSQGSSVASSLGVPNAACPCATDVPPPPDAGAETGTEGSSPGATGDPSNGSPAGGVPGNSTGTDDANPGSAGGMSNSPPSGSSTGESSEGMQGSAGDGPPAPCSSDVSSPGNGAFPPGQPPAGSDPTKVNMLSLKHKNHPQMHGKGSAPGKH